MPRNLFVAGQTQMWKFHRRGAELSVEITTHTGRDPGEAVAGTDRQGLWRIVVGQTSTRSESVGFNFPDRRTSESHCGVNVVLPLGDVDRCAILDDIAESALFQQFCCIVTISHQIHTKILCGVREIPVPKIVLRSISHRIVAVCIESQNLERGSGLEGQGNQELGNRGSISRIGTTF